MTDQQESSFDVQNKRYLHAARTDDTDMLNEILTAGLDPNCCDGLGNTALHYAAFHQSTHVLAEMLDLEVDVDLQNRIEENTPLHEACRVEIPQGQEAGNQVEEIRNWIVNELLEAGSDPRIQNKNGDKPVDLFSYGSKANTQLGKQLVQRLKRGEAEMAINHSDIAHDDDDDEDGASNGTASDE